MPDWLTHTLVGWITGKTIRMDVSLVVIGSLIPDLVKIYLAFEWFNIDHHQFFNPLHTPVGGLLVAGIITLFFIEYKKAFLLLTIGLATHFILDFFLVHVAGGMKLLFPFSWEKWHYSLIWADDYWVTLVAILLAFIVFIIFYVLRKRNRHATDVT